MGKRLFDLFFAVAGLLILWPIFVVIAAAIKLETAGPVFFRQNRVGQFGRIFRIHKFRTMVADAEKRGGQLTIGSEARITRTGRFLRKYKLDELAQLIDVIKGDMSLVGPRPEVPRFVDEYSEEAKGIVFSVRPGITDFASIEFKDENAILENSQDPHGDYIEKILPIKIGYYKKYVEERSLWLDFKLIMKTIRAVFL